MFGILYNIFVMPIQVLVEMVYSIMFRIVGNQGIAIIFVSLIIQTLILPLYKRSDALQEEERQKQEEMSHWVTHIKKAFKGDERFMMLQTYYRQQGYKTIYSLKSSVSILLQIPFFMAAYNYLSHLEAVKGISFLFIKDLGAPDALFTIGGFPINILPILMTLANIVSGIIYTKGLPMKAKLQVYGLAAIFLVLLYNSPAGLVLYWTMNNVYSLMKNVVMKLLTPALQKSGLSEKFKPKEKSFWDKFVHVGEDKKLVIITEVALTILMGALIPISVISTSASEFIINDSNPYLLVLNNVTIYAGLFLIWFNIFYLLMKKRAKGIFATGLFAILFVGLFDYMVYGNKMGTMNTFLVYDAFPTFSKMTKTINLLIAWAIIIAIAVIAVKFAKYFKSVATIVVLGMVALCVVNGNKVNKAIDTYYSYRNNSGENGILTLSKEGTNVIVFMLDRAINGYIPFIFDEYPEIAESYADFTYYPNSISNSICTNYATPEMFGGYEYTLTAMNDRDDEPLASKHDEALKVMPKLFSDNGYNVVVCDPPYAGYQWSPDLSIYDDIPNVSAYITEGGYTSDVPDAIAENELQRQKTNFMYYSIAKTIPLWLHNRFYDNGNYCATNVVKSEVSDLFLNCYTVLTSLPRMTSIDEGDSDNLLLIQNAVTHEPITMKMPECEVALDVNTAEEFAKQQVLNVDGHVMTIKSEIALQHWHTNIAAMREIGKWIDFLKENDVYDNTRIIITSDHGRWLDCFEYSLIDEVGTGNRISVENAQALLMVKDFNSSGYQVSDEFMTIGDIPTLAVKDVIDNPVNPYTGNLITNEDKKNPQVVTYSENWDIYVNNGNVFDMYDMSVYTVKDNIFDPVNWTRID